MSTATASNKIVKCDTCKVISQCVVVNGKGGKCLMAEHNNQIKANNKSN